MWRTALQLTAVLVLAGLVAGCATGLPGTAPDTGTPGTPDTGTSLTALETLCADLVNAERTSRGLPALTFASDVLTVARAHSTDMATRDYFDHNTPEGLGPADRAQNAGITYSTYGENIAWTSARAGRTDQELAATIVQGWMDSTLHRENILRTAFVEQGLGIAESANGIYFTQNFIAR